MVLSVIAVVYEYPRLRRAKQFKELWLFMILLAVGVLLSVAEELHLPIPDPLNWLTAIYKPMSRIVLSALN
nr:hypothetical protein [Paenibacillus sacheonensis]